MLIFVTIVTTLISTFDFDLGDKETDYGKNLAFWLNGLQAYNYYLS